MVCCIKDVFLFVLIFIFALCARYSKSVFILEELKLLNYEVDILKTPVKAGEEQNYPMLHLTSKYGQTYQCLLPQIDEKDEVLEKKEESNEEVIDIKELLKPIQSGSCLLKTKDWWTYEFCYGHYIKQYHIEDGKILGQVLTLGLYESDFDWDSDTAQDKFKHAKQRYHSQIYTNGTKCDLTGLPRNAEVRFFCEEDAGDYIFRVDEPGTCSYILTVHTSRLCSHPLLKPPPTNKAHTIACSPLLNEEQYSLYLNKIYEEKTVAAEKRNQWLTNQHERLKNMKTWTKENLINLEGANGEKSEFLPDVEKKSEKSVEETLIKDTDGTVMPPPAETENPSLENNQDVIDKMMLQEYDREMNSLKSAFTGEQSSTSIKDDLQEEFDSILNEGDEDLEQDLNEKKGSSKLASTLIMLLEKLDKAEKGTAQELEKSVFGAKKTDEKLKANEDEQSQSAVLDDDKLHVRIRRLDKSSHDGNGKLHEMDFVQRKKLEQAVREKLEKAGLDTGGRRIEVKIITAGYYDNEDGKDFHSLSDEETSQFQNMIMALLTGQQEAVQEIERQKKLEENYKFVWEKEPEKTEELED